MRSITLNKSMREEILTSVIDQWLKTNTAPDIEAAEGKFALDVWKKYYRKYETVLTGVPAKFLKTTNTINVTVNSEVVQLRLAVAKPRDWQQYSQTVLEVVKDTDARYVKYEAVRDAFKSWNEDLDSIKAEAKAIIESVNTTKQLNEIWPEVIKFLPAYISDPSKAIKLPALKVSRLNERLGIE